MTYLLNFNIFSLLLVYKYVALFILVLLAGIGLPIPTNVLLVTVGVFINQKEFNFFFSLAVALTATVLGDIFQYWLARTYGPPVMKRLQKRFLKGLRTLIETVEHYFKKHEGITILVTRFFGTASVIVNFLSGLVPVSFFRFLFYDAVGNATDIALMLGIGLFVGQSWQSIAQAVGLAGSVVTTSVLLIIVIMLIRRFDKNNS